MRSTRSTGTFRRLLARGTPGASSVSSRGTVSSVERVASTEPLPAAGVLTPAVADTGPRVPSPGAAEELRFRLLSRLAWATLY